MEQKKKFVIQATSIQGEVYIRPGLKSWTDSFERAMKWKYPTDSLEHIKKITLLDRHVRKLEKKWGHLLQDIGWVEITLSEANASRNGPSS